ncbi:MAG: acyl-CoA dehydrogenase family protein [Deltaproteobacteria bacterium]|nr:acyl-CoA dehydrogenase family protein [Deltaproteobacteria bacterium]
MDRETLQVVLQTFKDFTSRELTRERCLELDERDEYPEDLVNEMMGEELGLHLVFLPEEYGGLGGGAYDVYRVSLALAEADLGIATAFFAISLGTDPLRVGGTDEQKQKWMTRIAEEGLVVAYGVTEPAAGSEVSAIKTTARRVTDDDGNVTGYVLDGTKQFITNGGVATIYTILAKTEDGPSFFVVERGTEGLSAGRSEEKLGIRASNTTQVVLEDVHVPADNLIGGVEGQGLIHAQQVFGYTRVMVAAFGLGAGAEALRIARDYSKERIQYGSALAAKQGFTHSLLVPHAVALEASRTYIEYVAGRLDEGDEGLGTEGAIAKLTATEAGNAAADAAIQAHGGYGYIREYHVEKIRRDVRITTLYEGTSEIMRNTIAMDRWRASIQSRFSYYDDLAVSMDALSESDPGCGGGMVAHASRALNQVLRTAREHKLTRKQYVLFLLGDMMAGVETAACLARRASQIRSNGGKEEGLLFVIDAEAAGALARTWARRVGWDVVSRASYCTAGTGRLGGDALEAVRAFVAPDRFFMAGEGAEADMDLIASRITEG